MKWFLIFSPFLLLNAEGPKSDQEIRTWLPTLLERGKRFANVDPEDGQILLDLVLKVKAQRVLEIGTSTGYSGIWLAMGLRKTGGTMVTLELDPTRHESAKANFKYAGLDSLIDARLGNAMVETPKVEGPLDLVFLDADKPGYVKYYDMVIGKVRPGGVIVAHNTQNLPQQMDAFLERIKTDPRVTTEFLRGGGQGISVSWKK